MTQRTLITLSYNKTITALVNIIYLRTIDLYINLNKSQ